MKPIFVLLMLSFLLTLPFSSYCQGKHAVIIYPDDAAIILNANANLGQALKKEVDQKGIKLVKMGLFIDRPSHLYHLNSNEMGGSFSFNNHSSIILPGDSLVFTDEKTMKYSPFNNQMIDDLLSMDLAYSPFVSGEKKKLIAQQSLTIQVENIEIIYQQNIKRIRELKIIDTLKSVLADFNYILKCKTIVDLKTENLTAIEKKIIDSLYQSIFASYPSLERINSPFVQVIYRGMLQHYLNSVGIFGDKVWDNLTKLSKFPFLKNYLITALYNNQASPRQRDDLFTTIKAAGLADPEITAVYLELKNKKPVLENLVVPNLDKIRLSDRNGKELSLATILSRNKGKIILVDFWASWCVPCRGELPKFVKYRSQFKNSPVTFVNFSIDLDSKIADWKKALIEEKETNSPNQFRLVDWENSELAKLIGLRSIPRYIIINDKGKILNSEFLRPSNPAFAEELKKYISTIASK